VVSLRAPDNAKREYEKARNDYDNKKYENAEKHLAKALEIYPQYAIAWELRGQGQEHQKQDEDATKSYQAAISADEKFISPYIHLAVLDASKGNWPEVVSLTERAIKLDPISYPDAYFLNGAAHYNLKQYPEAEKSASKAVELDKEHRFARAELLLGSILQVKGDHAAAAEHMRMFLKMDPNSPEAPKIQTYLAKVDQQNASAKPAPQKP
jgi:tetratricopeptide (TPR) repeat protein